MGVVEGRTDHKIAAQITEARDRGKHRRIEPAIHRAKNPYGPAGIRPKRAGHTVDNAIRRDDVHGVSTLRLENHGKDPAFDAAVAVKRQGVHAADDEALPGIEVRKTSVAAQIIAILNDDALRAV